jgi:hypothetical protein
MGSLQGQRGAPLVSRAQIVGGLALAAVVVVLLPRALLLGEAFYERDLTFDWVTQTEVFVRCVASGSWPLWDNAKAFGQPLLANPDAQVLYPPTWLNLVLRPWTYYTLFVAAHLLWAGLGAAALARAFGVSRGAAVAAGALFMASGPMLSLLNVWHHFASAAWIPWVALGAQSTAETRRLRGALGWTLASAAQLLAGSADMCVAGQILAGVLVLRRLSWRRPLGPDNRRLIGLAVLAVALSAGLTAAQWLPTLDQARRSRRFAMPEAMRTARSLRPLALLQVAFPVPLWDAPLGPAAAAALAPAGDSFLRSIHLGLPALALAAAALAGGRHGPRRTLALLATVSTLFALGPHTPLYSIAAALLPVLRLFRYPSKAMILVALSVALLAGQGADAWRSGVSRRRWLWAVVVPLAAGVLLATLGAAAAFLGVGASLLAPSTPDAAQFLETAGRQLAAGAAVGAVALGVALRLDTAAWVAVAALAGLAIASDDVNRTTRRATLDLRPPILDAVAPLPPGSAAQPLGRPRLYVFEYLGDPERTRRYLHRDDPYPIRVPAGMRLREAQVLAQRLYPFPPVAGRWGFEGSYDRDYQGLYPWYLADLSRLTVSAEGTALHAWLMRVGAVGHVVALHSQELSELEEVGARPTLFPEPARAFRVPRARPRAYVVSGARPGADTGALVRASADMDPGREALIADLPVRVPPTPGFVGEVRHLEVRPDRVRAEVAASGPGWLVLVDTFDPGWAARLDGAAAPLLRANVAFRAVRVPTGEHTVEIVYRPRALTAGLMVSGLALLALCGLGWSARLPAPAAVRGGAIDGPAKGA